MVVKMALDNFKNKERDPRGFLEKENQGGEKAVKIVEVGRSPDIPPGLEGYLEKVEGEDHFLAGQVLDDQTGQPLVTSPQAPKPTIILPLTAREYQAGLEKPLELAWRWLSEWSKRVKKMLGSQVGFRMEK